MADQLPRIRIFQTEDTAPGHAVIHLGGVARAPLDESFTIARADDEPLAPGSNWPQGPRQPLSSEWHEERQILELRIGPDIVQPIQGGTPVLLRLPGLGREETLIWPDDLMLQPEGARLWRRPDRRSTRAQVVTPLDGRAAPVRRTESLGDAAKADLARKAEEVAAAERRREAEALAAKAAEAQALEEQQTRESEARKAAELEETRKAEELRKTEAAKAEALRNAEEARLRKDAEDKAKAADAKKNGIPGERARGGFATILIGSLAGLLVGAAAVEGWHQLHPPAAAETAKMSTGAAHVANVLCAKPGEDRRRALERLLTTGPSSPMGIPAGALTSEMVQRLAAGTYAGSGGQERDSDEALFWARQMARRGRFSPILGDLYREGTPQNRADTQLAELAWQLAAAAGSGKAMLSLGKFYEDGACGTETRVNAEFWYGLAARDNDAAVREAATDGLNRVAIKQ